jgi:hypothetical protein
VGVFSRLKIISIIVGMGLTWTILLSGGGGDMAMVSFLYRDGLNHSKIISIIVVKGCRERECYYSCGWGGKGVMSLYI